MESAEPSVLLIIVAVLGAWFAMAALFLWVGQLVKRRYPAATSSRLSATVHVIALFGFVIGTLLAWMAYDSDHPVKERHLLMPLAFPLLAYGYIAILWLKGVAVALVSSVLSLFSKGGR